jgi:transcription antitermination factor NusG
MTMPHEEYRAAHHIEKLGFQYYLPIMNAATKVGECIRHLIYPRYIFILLQMGWQHLMRLPGIRRFFLLDEMPIPVPRRSIEALKALEGKDGLIKIPDRLQPNMLVSVREGMSSLGGQQCRVVRMRDSGRCEIRISLLGRDVRTVLNASALEEVVV